MTLNPRTRHELYDPEWVIEGLIARSQRPGYPVDKPSDEKIRNWAENVTALGIKSVLCILDNLHNVTVIYLSYAYWVAR